MGLYSNKHSKPTPCRDDIAGARFKNEKSIDRALDIIWEKRKRFPSIIIADEKTLIVPISAINIFREANLNFKVEGVIDRERLTLAEKRQLNKERKK